MTMRSILVGILLCCFLGLRLLGAQAQPLPQEETVVLVIYSPIPGQALQGILPIDVGMDVPGLASAFLEFRYTNHPTDTWFLLAQTTEPVVDGILAQWDTTTISDGVYDLRLSVITQDQQQHEFVVAGLRIRNYSPIETDTPTPIVPTETLYPGQSTRTPLPSVTPLPPTVTPLPTNPAILTLSQFSKSLAAGSLAVVLFFTALGIYTAGRTFWRSRGVSK